MFSKTSSKKTSLDPHQKELFEHAQQRIKEKKGLYTHFIFYLVGSIFLAIINLLLEFGKEYTFLNLDWFVFIIAIWFFFLLVHAVRILIFGKFMGKEWETKQMGYLVKKQKEKIAKMEAKLNLKIPKEASNSKTILLDKTQNYLTNNEPLD